MRSKLTTTNSEEFSFYLLPTRIRSGKANTHMDYSRLREIRIRRALTQQDLARRIGVSPQQIHRYESGANDAAGDVIARLCRELRVTSDYLLGLVDKPYEHSSTPIDIDPLALKIDAAIKSADPGQLGRVTTELVNTAWRIASASKAAAQLA